MFFLPCLPLCWTLAWHEVPGICILIMTSLNYSHVHEPWVQKQGWKTTSVQCSGRAHSGELSVQAFLLSFTALRGFCVFFNAALQIEKKKTQNVCILHFLPLLLSPIFPEPRSKLHTLNCPSAVNWHCPRGMAFCKSTLNPGLHDGMSGFWGWFLFLFFWGLGNVQHSPFSPWFQSTSKDLYFYLRLNVGT